MLRRLLIAALAAVIFTVAVPSAAQAWPWWSTSPSVAPPPGAYNANIPWPLVSKQHAEYIVANHGGPYYNPILPIPPGAWNLCGWMGTQYPHPQCHTYWTGHSSTHRNSDGSVTAYVNVGHMYSRRFCRLRGRIHAIPGSFAINGAIVLEGCWWY